MQVILFDNIDRLGLKGDVVNVANGYYRNYLGPRNLALDASEANLKRLEAKRRKLKSEAEKQRQEAEGFASQLANAKIVFTRKSPDGDKLFGSVTAHEIFDALVAQGFNLQRQQIALRESLKTVGTHTVKIRLIGQMEGHVKVVVEPEKEDEVAAAPAEAVAVKPAEQPEEPKEA
jgi:large subunit ribosomal protein L9